MSLYPKFSLNIFYHRRSVYPEIPRDHPDISVSHAVVEGRKVAAVDSCLDPRKPGSLLPT
jgi:hypothetical protein